MHWPRAILHVDMDAFFVNVHILDHPEDSGIPLAVGGRPEQRGVVTSASYEARRHGIHSAMPMYKAVRLYPQLKIVAADWARIRSCSQQVMALLARFGPLEKMSVDEAYIDLTAHPEPHQAALQIKEKVRQDTGLPCSVGLATSKLVAKVASDHDKPDGFKIVLPGTEASFLEPLPTRAISGIGPRTAGRLAALDIHTCGQLANADAGLLQSVLGSHAVQLIERAQGRDERTVQEERGLAKSISQEWTFSEDVNDPRVLRTQLHKMSHKVAASLQKNGVIAHTVVVKFRWADFTTFTRQKSVSVGIDQGEDIFRLASAIWEENWPPHVYIRLLGVGASNLQLPAGRQLKFSFVSSAED